MVGAAAEDFIISRNEQFALHNDIIIKFIVQI